MYLQKLIQFKKENRKIAIIGLGQENIQFLQWLVDAVNFPVENLVLADKNELPKLPENLIDKLEKSVKFYGLNYLECLNLPDLEWVFKAPGIHSLKPEFEIFRNKKGDWAVTSSLVFFLEKFRKNIVGVTGTKGKSTTSSLTHFILKNVLNLNSEYCGNTTGISPYKFWNNLESVDQINTYWVIELSSFQLQDLGFAKISPARSIITNYYTDHQDQHNSYLEYWRSKDQIFIHGQTFLVANEQIKNLTSADLSSKFLLNIEEAKKITSNLKFNLQGDHNIMNLAEALVIAANLQGKAENLKEVSNWIESKIALLNNWLPQFKTLPHRLENIRQDNLDIKILGSNKRLKINWIDDGYATEPDAVVAAIQSVPTVLGNFLWLWLAGVDKGSNLDTLVDAIFEKQIHSELYSVEYCGGVGKRILTELYAKIGSKQDMEISLFKNAVLDLLPNIQTIKTEFQSWIDNLIDELKFTEQNDFLEELSDLEEINLHIIFSPSGSSFDEFKNVSERADWWVDWAKGMK